MRRVCSLTAVVATLVTATVSAQNYGTQKIIILPANSETNQAQPHTQAELIATFAPDSTWTQFWFDASYGRIGPWQATVRPWVTRMVAGYFGSGFMGGSVDYNGCNMGLLWQYADFMAAVDGVPLTTFPRRVYLTPQFNCATLGESTTGALPSVTRLTGTAIPALLCHELGHAFGLLHAKTRDNSNGTYSVNEYGDRYSCLGWPMGYGQPGAEMKRSLRWLDTVFSPRTITISQSGTYTIEPFERPTTPQGIVAIRIPSPDGVDPLSFLVLEARVNGDMVQYGAGVIVRSAQTIYEQTPTQLVINRDLMDPSRHYLLDLDGGDSTSSDYTLSVGQSFTHPFFQVTVTTLAFGPTGATIRVDLLSPRCSGGPCAPPKPTTPIPVSVPGGM